MNYEQYIPQFLRKPPAPVAFPPLLPDRWGSYPSAQAILTGADRSFYADPTVNPNAKSREFRKAVAADWASDTLKYNPHYFTNFPFGLARDGNFDNSTLEQTLYLKGMLGDDFLERNIKDVSDQELEEADIELNPPAHTATHLINNLTIPYIAGEKLYAVNTPTRRAEMLKDKKRYKRDSLYYGDKAIDAIGGKGEYAQMVDRNIAQVEAMTNPRYLAEPIEALGWTHLSSVDPTERQLERVRHYRSLIDRAAGVDPDVPWQYNYE